MAAYRAEEDSAILLALLVPTEVTGNVPTAERLGFFAFPRKYHHLFVYCSQHDEGGHKRAFLWDT